MFHVKLFGTIDGNIRSQGARFVFWARSSVRFDKVDIGPERHQIADLNGFLEGYAMAARRRVSRLWRFEALP
jgi:hypothetical protein